MIVPPSSFRLDLKCGKGAISKGEKCTKGPATAAKVAVGVGLTAGALALGAAALSRRSPRGRTNPSASRPSSASTPPKPTPSTPQLTGTSPRGLLKAAAPRRSKTQRMRENTAAAMRNAESRIAQTAREEVRRIAQIGNTMATTGEATGMAAKTAFREIRLRTEAARRRFEPGYRTTKPPAPKAPAQLPEGGSAFTIPAATPQPLTPDVISIDPRTGQPRRRRPQGFGRSDSGVQFLHTQYIDPGRQRTDGSTPGQGKRCGAGFTSRNNQCRQNPSGGPRNYATEIQQELNTMSANDINSWRRANKLRKPTTEGALERQLKEYSTSAQGAAVGAAWKRRTQLVAERDRRNAGYAFLGGAALGVAGLALSASRRRR